MVRCPVTSGIDPDCHAQQESAVGHPSACLLLRLHDCSHAREGPLRAGSSMHGGLVLTHSAIHAQGELRAKNPCSAAAHGGQRAGRAARAMLTPPASL